MSELLYKSESWAIRQAAFDVHKLLGCGFLEKVYQEALAEEFRLRGIPFEREKAIRIQYKGKLLEQEYFADFVCYDKIIIELKALKEIHDVHKAQTYNYLRATDYALGLLMNFGEHSLVVERIVNFNSSRIKFIVISISYPCFKNSFVISLDTSPSSCCSALPKALKEV